MTQMKHTQTCSLTPGQDQPKSVPAGDDRRLTFSNRAEKIQVGLELAKCETLPRKPKEKEESHRCKQQSPVCSNPCG